MNLAFVLAVVAGAFVFTGLTWLTSELAWRRMNPLAQRELLMNEPAPVPVVESVRRKTVRQLQRRGLTDQLDRTLLRVTGVYLAALLAGSVLNVNRVVVVIVALPAAVLPTLAGNRRRLDQQERLLRSQLLGVFESLAAMIESGDTVPGAVGKLAARLEEPLRSEFSALADSYAVHSSLVPGLRALNRRHPSRPMRLLTAAVEVDEELGVRLAPVLRQAGAMLERDQELAAEAVAELSQARSEFIGICTVIGGIAALMLLGSEGAARQAYSTVAGILFVGIGVANYAFGVARTLRVLRRAREVTV